VIRAVRKCIDWLTGGSPPRDVPQAVHRQSPMGGMVILQWNRCWYIFRDGPPPPPGRWVRVRWLCSFQTEQDALTWLGSFQSGEVNTVAATRLFLTLHGNLPASCDVHIEVERTAFLLARRSKFVRRRVMTGPVPAREPL
jgi:hypothetical protein